MRVLGIDPGLSRCGVAVVDGPSHRPQLVRAGVVRTSTEHSTAQRLATLHAALAQVVAETHPDAVAVERVFVKAIANNGVPTAQAAGVALLAGAVAGLHVSEYTATQVKLAITGTGGADKDQVGFMVRAMLRLASPPKPADTADALALALCHLQHAGSGRRSTA